MKISLDWLNEYVKVGLPLPELLERLTMIGLVAEKTEEIGGDRVLEVETYANRPDTLGHLGIAREVAAMTGARLHERKWPVVEHSDRTADVTDVQVLDETSCPRYCGLLVRGVAVGPSPDWLRTKIEAMGVRTVNNVVDVTNYVLFATGQPIHAFDFRKLAGGRIVVRRAMKGEKLTSLDGGVIELTPEMLVIADEEKPVALAGVMGGEETGVTDATVDVFVESACFDPVSVRLTAKKVGLSTDASYRFERGTDIAFPPEAARMAASLLGKFGGKASRGLIDVYPKPRKPKSVVLRHRRIFDLLGVEVPEDFVPRLLADLGFRVEESQKGTWIAEVPSFRVDIEREADLIEEVARFYGYDRIPSEPTPLCSFEPPANRKRERIQKLRQVLLHHGFDEVINFSFSDPEKEAALGSGKEPVALLNPLSARSATMRTTLMMGLLENAARNLNRGLEGVHIFEAGGVYFRHDEDYCEQLSLGLLATGRLGAPHWQSRPEETDFFVLKGAVEAVMTALRYEPFSFEEAGHPFFEPGEALALVYKSEKVGSLGVLRKALRDLYSVEGTVYAAEIDLAGLMEKQPKPFVFAPVPKFPGAVRDLSFLLDRKLSWRDVQQVLSRLSVPILEGFELTDRFSGPSVPPDKVSLSVRFRYRSAQRTLLAEEVDKAQQEVVGHLRSALNATLREGGKIDNRT
ncbi:MAG TPA: phenylalanine--tRNA ligase subunit beta [Acidobacteriota bacterium]|nr:phenylalanine--tRNA ligase subunit beta [Acidobacteriota bacterium]